jgi:hypothetical protein
MTAPRDPDRLINAFIQEGAEQLPDQVYDAVRADIEQRRQRVAGPWRMPIMNRIVGFGLVAAAVVAAVLIESQLFGNRDGGLGSPATPTPRPSVAAATPSPTASPRAALPPTEGFTSERHGISVSYPAGWKVQAATKSWTDRTFSLNFGAPHADYLYDPTLTSSLFITLASQPIGDSTPEAWVAAQMASGEGCAASKPVALDGAAGLIGTDGCQVVAVTAGGRGYWIELYTSGDQAWISDAYDQAWFEDFLATVQLKPRTAIN